MVSEEFVNIGSCDGLLCDGTKPLAGPMLTCFEWDPMACIVVSLEDLQISIFHMCLKVPL